MNPSPLHWEWGALALDCQGSPSSSLLSLIYIVVFHFLLQDGHELPPPIAFDVEAPTTLPPCKVSGEVASEGHRARTHVGRRVLVPWSCLIGVCLIPGKLLWNRDPEESGPALLAAVSILGVLRLGSSGPSTTQS